MIRERIAQRRLEISQARARLEKAKAKVKAKVQEDRPPLVRRKPQAEPETTVPKKAAALTVKPPKRAPKPKAQPSQDNLPKAGPDEWIEGDDEMVFGEDGIPIGPDGLPQYTKEDKEQMDREMAAEAAGEVSLQ